MYFPLKVPCSPTLVIIIRHVWNFASYHHGHANQPPPDLVSIASSYSIFETHSVTLHVFSFLLSDTDWCLKTASLINNWRRNKTKTPSSDSSVWLTSTVFIVAYEQYLQASSKCCSFSIPRRRIICYFLWVVCTKITKPILIVSSWSS